MPQLETASFISQAFWLVVCFCILWGLLSIFITPKLTDIIERRKRKINDYIQKAEALNAQAESSLSQYNEKITKAHQLAAQELTIGKENLQDYLNKTQQQLNQDLQQKVEKENQFLNKEKLQTLKQIEEISCDMAYTIVQKLGFSTITKDDIVKISTEDKNNG